MQTARRFQAVVTRVPIVAGPETSFARALELMEENDIAHLPVIDQGQLVGIVHERDLLRGLLGAPSIR